MTIKAVLKKLRALGVRLCTGTRVSGYIGNRIQLNDARLHRCRIEILGRGNELVISAGALLHGVSIKMVGDGNRCVIGSRVCIRGGGTVVVEDGGGEIVIGDGTSMTGPVIVCSEQGRIKIGDDCMVAFGTCIRNSDGHSIYDLRSGLRLNVSADVLIGRHVWLGIRSMILKGAVVHPGAVVGAHTVVVGTIPANTVAVGTPMRIVRTDVAWGRERAQSNESRTPFEELLPEAGSPKRDLKLERAES